MILQELKFMSKTLMVWYFFGKQTCSFLGPMNLPLEELLYGIFTTLLGKHKGLVLAQGAFRIVPLVGLDVVNHYGFAY